MSTIAAFSAAMLLAIGPSAAYADDTAPPTDPAATDTAAPADPTATDTAAPADRAPATDPAPTTDPASSSGQAPSIDTAQLNDPSPAATASTTDTGSTAPTAAGGKKSPTSAKVVAPLLAGCTGANGTPHVIGGFEIDGNTCVDTTGNIDWESNVDNNSDGVNDILYRFDDAKDTTAYTQGDAERDDPAGWHTGGSSQGKDDITDAWSYTKIVSGDVWTFFGVKRVADNGTTTYDVELNHLTNDPGVQNPRRTAATHEDPTDPSSPLGGGDLLLQFSVNGTGPLTFDKAYQWTARADFPSGADCFGPASPYGFGWCPLNTVVTPNFESAHSADGLFAEGAVNLSALARVNGQTCTGSFGVMNLRTVASEEHTAALQDYVLPFPTNIPSSCPSLVIQKYAGGALTAGAHFDVYSGTTATGTPLYSDVYDGKVGVDTDSVTGQITIKDIEPGDYTVQETTPPSGYLLPADTTCNTYPFTSANACRTETASATPGTTGTVTFAFYDPKAWDALTVDKTAQGEYTLTYPWTLNKQISETGDPGSWVDGTTPGDPLVKNVGAGGDTSLYYRVLVDHAGDPVGSNYVVKGTITVHNTNDANVSATLSDSLTGCTLDVGGASISGAGTSVTANASGDTNFAYTCDLGDTAPASTLKNKATITWSMTDYPQATAQNEADTDPTHYAADTGDVTFQPFTETSSVNKSVVVVDDNGTPSDTSDDTTLGTVNWADAPWTSNVYSNDPAPALGDCSAVITNTATLFVGRSALSSPSPSSESGKVCQGNAADLTVAATVTESLTRTFPWAIDKTTSTPTVQVSGGQAVADYSVTVTAGASVDSAWAMSGTVSVHNPNGFESVDLTDLTVDYTGAADETCTVHESTTVSIAANGSEPFTYDCTFPTAPSLTGAIVATATWDGATAGTVNSSADNPAGADTDVVEAEWTVTPVNDDSIKVWDDHATPADTSDDTLLATLDWADVWAMPNHRKTLAPYSITFTTGLPAAGTCNGRTNTARVIGDNAAVLAHDSANVSVCTPAVIVSPPSPPQHHPSVLPNTGGPDRGLLGAGLALVLGGGLLIAGDRRRKHRS